MTLTLMETMRRSDKASTSAQAVVSLGEIIVLIQPLVVRSGDMETSLVDIVELGEPEKC